LASYYFLYRHAPYALTLSVSIPKLLYTRKFFGLKFEKTVSQLSYKLIIMADNQNQEPGERNLSLQEVLEQVRTLEEQVRTLENKQRELNEQTELSGAYSVTLARKTEKEIRELKAQVTTIQATVSSSEQLRAQRATLVEQARGWWEQLLTWVRNLNWKEWAIAIAVVAASSYVIYNRLAANAPAENARGIPQAENAPTENALAELWEITKTLIYELRQTLNNRDVPELPQNLPEQHVPASTSIRTAAAVIPIAAAATPLLGLAAAIHC
jgi:hypothetical protein